MPNYFYTAKSLDGKTVTGNATAASDRQLAQDLKAQGAVLIRAVLEDQKAKKSLFGRSFSLFGVSSAEKIIMTRNLGVMFSAGLSLVKSFEILSVQVKDKNLQAALLDIKEKIGKGDLLSDSLARYPKIFSELFCNMIKVGEESGTLDEIFQILSLQLGKEHELKSKIKNAMIYPSMIMMVMLGVGVVIITMVLPSLNVFFSSLNVPIPFYTRMVLGGGAFLSTHWYLLILVPMALAGIFIAIIKTKKGKRGLDTFLLKLPVISPIVKKSNSAFMIRSLSSLIAAGVSLIRSLEISSKTVGNHYYSEALIQASAKIKKGDKFSSALQADKALFPYGVIEMIEVGEETGKTAAILKKLADFYEQEAGAAVEKLAILIEPILIIFLGISVGFFAISIIQPMYSSLKFVGS